MIRVRPGLPEDADGICQIWNPIIRDSVATFTTALKTPERLHETIRTAPVFVAEQEQKVLGFATYFQFRGGPGYAHTMEHTVHVAPEAQGQGLGRALMTAVQDDARQRGVHSLWAGVSGENPDGVLFHRALGFQEIATLPQVGRKFGRWMDLVLMQKLL